MMYEKLLDRMKEGSTKELHRSKSTWLGHVFRVIRILIEAQEGSGKGYVKSGKRKFSDDAKAGRYHAVKELINWQWQSAIASQQ